jgi:hypothetical protein
VPLKRQRRNLRTPKPRVAKVRPIDFNTPCFFKGVLTLPLLLNNGLLEPYLILYLNLELGLLFL